MVKKLCSTDIIYAEKKFKAPFEFSASHTLVLHTNHLPRVQADDDGTWRRLVVVPFEAVIPKDDEKKDYADILFEEAGGAVLQWMIDGASEFINSGFKLEQPERVKTSTSYYRADNDWMGNFLSAYCEIGTRYQEVSSALYNRYQDFCKEENENCVTVQIFNNALDQRGFRKWRTNSARYRIGLRLKEEKAFSIPAVTPPSAGKAPMYEVGDGGGTEIVNF